MVEKSEVRNYNGVPTLFLDDVPEPAMVAYVRPEHMGSFVKAGFRLYTVTVPRGWWLEPDRYDFAAVDKLIDGFVERSPEALFMPRVVLHSEGRDWWVTAHPEELVVLRDNETNEIVDPYTGHTEYTKLLGHGLDLKGMNLHSFASEVWQKDAAKAMMSFIDHCEKSGFHDRIWGYHICDGLFQEWFHWHVFSLGALPDYSEPIVRKFRLWLRDKYGNDEETLSESWGRKTDFDAVEIPLPRERLSTAEMEFYDPSKNRASIDYMHSFNESVADCIVRLCQGAKSALKKPKVVGVFYGYAFNHMIRPQLNGHYSLTKVLHSPAVDFVANPHHYDNRGLGGYHSSQNVTDSIRRHGKLCFDELDCKTVWTPNTVTWKRHISQPDTAEDTIEMMKKDAGADLASTSGLWWTDLTNEGWFDNDDAVEPMRRLKEIGQGSMDMPKSSFGEVALVVDEKSFLYHRYRPNISVPFLTLLKQWHLARMGAPFEQLLIDDLADPGTPDYKLYIFANPFHLSANERKIIRGKVRKGGSTVVWTYAPGFIDDNGASIANMEQLTGIRFGCQRIEAELRVDITDYSHPITEGLPRGFAYGTDVNVDEYVQPPKIQWYPEETKVGPAFYAEDEPAVVLGIAASTGRPGLVVKEFKDWRSIYTAAPMLSWEVLRNLARYAGVHIYSYQGDFVWGNSSFLAIHSRTKGKRDVKLPSKMTVEDAYERVEIARNTTSITVDFVPNKCMIYLLR